eukprot:scaffold294185_cov41-Prasinocladus_malaysianus.AAC.1
MQLSIRPLRMPAKYYLLLHQVAPPFLSVPTQMKLMAKRMGSELADVLRGDPKGVGGAGQEGALARVQAEGPNTYPAAPHQLDLHGA